MPAAPTLRVAVFADQASRVEFTNPDNSAIIRAFRQALGDALHVTLPDAQAVRSGTAFDTQPDVFVLPGIFGETCLYPQHLGPEGYAHIQNFVASGGVFMGFCAGAYYAAHSILYTPVWGASRLRETGILSLVAAQAFGPLPGYCAPEGDERAAVPEGWHRVDPVAVELASGARMRMAYGLGPAFAVAANDPRIRIHARYADVPGQPAAIIEGAYGHGRALLYGALPQFNYNQIRHEYRARRVQPGFDALRRALYADRGALARFWAGQIGIVLQHRRTLAAA